MPQVAEDRIRESGTPGGSGARVDPAGRAPGPGGAAPVQQSAARAARHGVPGATQTRQCRALPLRNPRPDLLASPSGNPSPYSLLPSATASSPLCPAPPRGAPTGASQSGWPVRASQLRTNPSQVPHHTRPLATAPCDTPVVEAAPPARRPRKTCVDYPISAGRQFAAKPRRRIARWLRPHRGGGP